MKRVRDRVCNVIKSFEVTLNSKHKSRKMNKEKYRNTKK